MSTYMHTHKYLQVLADMRGATGKCKIKDLETRRQCVGIFFFQLK